MEERVRRVKREMGVKEPLEEYKPQIKGTFVRGTTHLRRNKAKGYDVRSRTYRNVRLLLIVVVLSFILWVFFFK